MAQLRFFHSKGAKKAGLTKADVAHYDAMSKGMKLPERAKPRKKRKAEGILKTQHS